jgi:phosphatidate cytidylyltransferase
MGIWIPFLLAVLLVRGTLFQGRKDLPSILGFVSSSTLTLFYPAFFLSWIVRLSGLDQPSATILFFLCLVFGNDMSAYFAGSLWGESTRLGLPISPQKSAVGFIAGLVGSLIIVSFFLPVRGFLPHPLAVSYLLGAVVGLAVMLGDLLESGLKRSAGVKDSGIVIPGRGGVLDSVDSMLLSAPLFYYAFVLAGR